MILKYLRPKDWALAAVCVALVLLQVYLDLRIPEFMSEITTHLQMGMGTDIVARDGTRMIACALVSFAAAVATGILASRISASLSRTLRELEFEKVQSFSHDDMDSFSAASLITRSTNDVYHLQQFVARGLVIVVKAPVMAVWAVLKISGSTLEWTAATAVAMIILLLAIFFIMRANMPLVRRIQWLMDGVNHSTRENLEGVRVIRAYNADGAQQERFDKANGDLLDNNVRVAHQMAPLHPISSSMLSFLTLAIYWIGAGILQSAPSQADQMQLFSDMIVFTSYAGQVITSVMMLTGIIRGLPRAMVSAGRIEEVIEHEPSIKGGDVQEGDGSRGTVEFRDVSFSYPRAGHEALSGISFEVGKGETFAIIGRTGSGKSSVANLIPRFYDVCSGAILVDGVDVREYDLEALHSKIGYVPQRAVIFEGTIRANVNFGQGSEDRTDEDIRRALDIAQASNFVDSLPEGMDSDLAQYGRTLSGGQKQRISIARAVCKDPEIYIFDDSFSALDFKTDLDLRTALKRATKDSTKIIVAQRIGTIIDADRIMVLDNGRMAGIGTHEELMRTCPLYAEIARSQLGEGA